MNLNDQYGLGLGAIEGATYNDDPTTGYSNLNVTINGQSVPGDVALSVPHCFPYGFFSIPTDDTYALMGNLSGTTMSPIVISDIPTNNDFYTLSGLETGESTLYSSKYSLQAKLLGLKAMIDNSAGQNTATMLWGENIVKVLIDILVQLTDLYDDQLGGIWEQLNNHTHTVDNVSSGSDAIVTNTMAAGGTTITAYPINPEIPEDLSDLTAGKGYVNETGAPM